MRALLIDQATGVIVAKHHDFRAMKLLGDRTPGLEVAVDTDKDSIIVGETFIAPGCHCLEDAPAHLTDQKLLDRIDEIRERLVLLEASTDVRKEAEQFGILNSQLEDRLETYDNCCIHWSVDQVPDLKHLISDVLASSGTSIIRGGSYVPAV